MLQFPAMFSGWRWSTILLAFSYLATGALFIMAVAQVAPSGSIREAVLLCGAGLLVFVLGSRFFAEGGPTPIDLPLGLSLCWGGGAASIVIGLTQVTPAGPARWFVLFGSTGAALALLGWRFFAHRRFPTGSEKARDDETQQGKDTRLTRDTVMTFCYVGAGGLVCYSLRYVVPAGPVENMFLVLGAGTLIACGSLLTGALFGFLFGIPRSQPGVIPQLTGAAKSPPNAATAAGNPTSTVASDGIADLPSTRRPAFEVNTNLEQISDWLTKIIVGLGLINLEKFPAYLRNLASYFAGSLGNVEAHDSVVLALIILYFVSGFLLGYLLTRLFLTGAFTRAQESPTSRLKRALQSAGPSSTSTGSQDVSAAQIAAIRRIDQVASQVPQDQLEKQVRSLASEYDVTRSSMPFSPDRTRRLDLIVVRMKGLAKQAYFMLPALVRGETPGERLAAIAFLQMQPDARYLSWLADRFGNETPFILYHAALALRNAVDNLGHSQFKYLRQALERAESNTPRNEKDILAILQEAKKQLDSLSEP